VQATTSFLQPRTFASNLLFGFFRNLSDRQRLYSCSARALCRGSGYKYIYNQGYFWTLRQALQAVAVRLTVKSSVTMEDPLVWQILHSLLFKTHIVLGSMTMGTQIKHVAICTENYDRLAEFYKTIFGMKKITNGMTDATGNYNPERGHISDGLIGYALLQRQPGISAGLDHFGFEVDDVSDVLEKLAEKYPDILASKTLDYVPFAGIRAHDPTGNQFDISQNQMANVREGYKESGWEQSRRLSHIAMRAIKPARLAKFYQDVFGLEKV
jgi:predicted enzyme related to lactoylglutathione lyase